MELPSTKMTLRDSDMKPYKSQGESLRREAQADKNFVGDSKYLAGVRRGA